MALDRYRWTGRENGKVLIHRTTAGRSTLCCCVMLTVTLTGNPVRAETDVQGVPEPMLTNVRALLRLDDLPCDAPPRLLQREFSDAPAQIRSALEVFGLYSPTIDSSFTAESECWQATFDVSLGEPVRFRDVNLRLTGEALDDEAFAALLDVPALAPGQPLLHAEYDRLKARLSRIAQQRGYVEATFAASRIDVYPDQLAADVALEFDSGPRYRFGKVALDQEALRDDLVLAYMGFSEGDYYDASALADYQIELGNTGYFDRISLVPQPPDAETKQIPLVIQLQPAPRKLLSYGIGLSTDTGVRARFVRSIRRFNDRGHQLNFNSQLSPVVSEVSAIYRMPYGDPRFEWLSFDAGGKREYTDTSKSRSIQFGARRVLQLQRDWTRTQSLSLLVEDFDVAEQQGRSRLLMPGLEWSRLRADNNLRPNRGSKLEFQLRAAADRVASDTSFLQLLVNGKWIWSVGSKGRILTRSQIGSTWEDEFRNLPPSVRFFAGGDESVRGYDFETLGPVDANGDVIGGSKIFTTSLEYEHRIKQRWSIAAFGDTGNAFEEESEIDLRTGIGIGARWQSPLGPIRIDIAKPLDGIDRDLRLHVSFGPDL